MDWFEFGRKILGILAPSDKCSECGCQLEAGVNCSICYARMCDECLIEHNCARREYEEAAMLYDSED